MILLVEANADINAFDLFGNTPLDVAIKKNQDEIAKYLLQLDRVVYGLWEYTKEGYIDSIKRVTDKEVNLDLRDKHGRTLLHIAALYKQIPIAEYLITKDINLTMNYPSCQNEKA